MASTVIDSKVFGTLFSTDEMRRVLHYHCSIVESFQRNPARQCGRICSLGRYQPRYRRYRSYLARKRSVSHYLARYEVMPTTCAQSCKKI